MTLDQFEMFAAVAKYGNVTRASEALHISQPALTQQLKHLEENYAVRLYAKTPSGIRLTNAGKLFLRSIKTILRQHERLKNRLSPATAVDEFDTLAVGATYSPSVSLIPSILASFEKSHPHVEIKFRTADRGSIDQMLMNSEIELAIVNNAIPNQYLVLEPYRREPVVVFVSRNHSLAKKHRITWRDIEHTPFVARKRLRGKSTADRVFESMKKMGLRPRVAMGCNSPDAVKTAVKRKIGVGILFKEAIGAEIRKREFKIIKLPGLHFEGQSFIVYRKNQPLSLNADKFLARLRKGKDKSIQRNPSK
jgi:DNA-binding transcriptional LysR family regulator